MGWAERLGKKLTKQPGHSAPALQGQTRPRRTPGHANRPAPVLSKPVFIDIDSGSAG
jgi:hypothetical protein